MTANRGGSSVGAGGAQAPPTPRNSMESIGKKEGEEGERKEGGRKKGVGGRRREMSPPRANRGFATASDHTVLGLLGGGCRRGAAFGWRGTVRTGHRGRVYRQVSPADISAAA